MISLREIRKLWVVQEPLVTTQVDSDVTWWTIINFAHVSYHCQNNHSHTTYIYGNKRRNGDGVVQLFVLHQKLHNFFDHFLNYVNLTCATWVRFSQRQTSFFVLHYLFMFQVTCEPFEWCQISSCARSGFGERRAGFQGTTENCKVTLPLPV